MVLREPAPDECHVLGTPHDDPERFAYEGTERSALLPAIDLAPARSLLKWHFMW